MASQAMAKMDLVNFPNLFPLRNLSSVNKRSKVLRIFGHNADGSLGSVKIAQQLKKNLKYNQNSSMKNATKGNFRREETLSTEELEDIKIIEELEQRQKTKKNEANNTSRVIDSVSPHRACALVRTLRVEEGGAYSDLLAGDDFSFNVSEMEYMQRTLGFKTRPLDAKSRRSATELVAASVRWKKYLDYIFFNCYNGPNNQLERIEPILLQIIRLGICELVKLEKPPHAVVNEMVELAKFSLRQGAGNFVNGILRKVWRLKESGQLPIPLIEGNERARARAMATINSHPVWIVRRWMARFGESEASKLMEWNNESPNFCLRINKMKGVTREQVCKMLDELEVEYVPSPFLDEFIRIGRGMQNVLSADLIKEGICSVQDESAGLVVSLLDPKPGETILDCCSAPGGKTLFAASRMQANGMIFALDINEGRLRLVKEGAKKQGFESMVKTITADLRNFAQNSNKQFDRVLLDAPCSGLGVLSKRADLRWRKSEEELQQLVALQSLLFDSAAKLVKPGGVLVYSTCSIEPEENSLQIASFLSRNKEFQVDDAREFISPKMVSEEGYLLTLPHVNFIDGAFGARLSKAKNS